jgi:hypothetical protein
MALPSTSGCLVAFDLRPSWGRHASSGSARHLAAMQDIWVSLHSIRSRSTVFWLHRRPNPGHRTSATISLSTSWFDTPLNIWLGILGYWMNWGLFEVGTPTRPPRGWPCQTRWTYARRSGCLYTSFDQDHDLVFLLFLEHQTSHAVYFNARGLLYECVFDTLLFPRRTDLMGNPFLITSSLDLIFLLFFFFGPSYRTSYPLWCSDTTHECIFDAL